MGAGTPPPGAHCQTPPESLVTRLRSRALLGYIHLPVPPPKQAPTQESPPLRPLGANATPFPHAAGGRCETALLKSRTQPTEKTGARHPKAQRRSSQQRCRGGMHMSIIKTGEGAWWVGGRGQLISNYRHTGNTQAPIPDTDCARALGAYTFSASVKHAPVYDLADIGIAPRQCMIICHSLPLVCSYAALGSGVAVDASFNMRNRRSPIYK